MQPTHRFSLSILAYLLAGQLADEVKSTRELLAELRQGLFVDHSGHFETLDEDGGMSGSIAEYITVCKAWEGDRRPAGGRVCVFF